MPACDNHRGRHVRNNITRCQADGGRNFRPVPADEQEIPARYAWLPEAGIGEWSGRLGESRRIPDQDTFEFGNAGRNSGIDSEDPTFPVCQQNAEIAEENAHPRLGAALGAAVNAGNGPSPVEPTAPPDPQLAAIVTAWPMLPDAIKAAMLAMVPQ